MLCGMATSSTPTKALSLLREETGKCNSSITADTFVFTAQGLLENGNVKKSLPGAKSDFYILAELLDAARDGNDTVFAAPYATNNSSLGPHHPFRGDMRAIATAANIVAPRTRGIGTMALAQSSCVGWPFLPSFHQRHPDFSGAPDLPPIMVVGSFDDEATRMQWSVQQRIQIPNAFNVWRNGGCHTDFHFMGETQKAIDAYLLNGNIPQGGTVYRT